MPYTIPRGVERRVVGTEHHPETIQKILERGFQSKTAELRREPDNPYDPNALAVWVDGMHAGYISSRMAAEYSPIIDRKFNGKRCLAHVLSLHQASDGSWILVLDMAWPSAFFRPDATQAQYANKVRGPITPIIGDWIEASLEAHAENQQPRQSPRERTKPEAPQARKPKDRKPHKNNLQQGPRHQPSPMDQVDPRGLLAPSDEEGATQPTLKQPGRGTGWKVLAIICWVPAMSIFVEPLGGTFWLALGCLCWWRSRVKHRRWENRHHAVECEERGNHG